MKRYPVAPAQARNSVLADWKRSKIDQKQADVIFVQIIGKIDIGPVAAFGSSSLAQND